jgi:ABC-type multidrug transport system ATPase subunit
VIEAREVRKSIGEKAILNGISFHSGEGIVALLGRNGAGKTSLLRILAGIWKSDGGTVSIAGHDLRSDGMAARRLLGFQPENPDLHPRMTPRELVDLVARARGVAPAAAQAAIDRFGAGPLLDVRCGSLSAGQRRLITLVAATMHEPEVLLLDEPTNALDPHRVAALKEYLRSASTRTALISTHQLDFVTTVAATFLLLREGRIAGFGTLEKLREQSSMPGASLEEIVLHTT